MRNTRKVSKNELPEGQREKNQTLTYVAHWLKSPVFGFFCHFDLFISPGRLKGFGRKLVTAFPEIKEKNKCFSFYGLRECFSEAESASIRSASKFCFDLDGRKNFQLFQKIIFRSIQSWGHDFFGEISNLSSRLDRPKKNFLEKLEKKSEHQGRRKICLRIEWKHSQHLKSTPGTSLDFFC